MTIGIVYYSRSNNTRTGARYLAGKLDGELVELVEKHGRAGAIGFLKSGYQAVTQKKSTLQGEPWARIRNFSTVYLMTPIWGSNGTPAMNRFVEEADFSGKEVTVVTFQADDKGAGSEKVHGVYREKIEAKGGRFVQGFALHSTMPGKFAGEEHIKAQVDKILQA
jgi:flavodoxin